MLRAHVAEYRRCRSCGAVYVAEPFWLADAYKQPIATADVGLVGRNVRLSRVTTRILRVCFPHARSFLDFGAGNGMFVRLMRDAGYAFRYYDPHGPNLFAPGHDGGLAPATAYDVATAFEVLEHLTEPTAELAPLVRSCHAILATTWVLPDPPPNLDSWWYYSLATGQHVTLYTSRSLDLLASQLGLVRSSRGDFHILGRRRVNSTLLRLLVSERIGCFLTPVAKRPSLLAADYELVTGSPLR